MMEIIAFIYCVIGVLLSLRVINSDDVVFTDFLDQAITVLAFALFWPVLIIAFLALRVLDE